MLNVERLAAAAAAFFVRIAEDEAGLQLLFDVIHLGADNEHDGFRVDQDCDPLILDDLVEFAFLVGVFERVGQTRAAAGAHPDPYPDRGLAATGEQRLYALRRGIRHDHSLLLRHIRSTPDALISPASND